VPIKPSRGPQSGSGQPRGNRPPGRRGSGGGRPQPPRDPQRPFDSQRPAGQRPRGGGHPGSSIAGRSVARNQIPDSLIYGLNPTIVALDLELVKVLYADGQSANPRINQLHAQAQLAGIPVQPLSRQGWAKALPADAHQGVAAALKPLAPTYLEDVISEAGEDSCVLVLDRIQDPHNLGAILRTAAASGVDAVVLPKKGGCPITPAVHRTSAGMSLLVRIVEDENIARALNDLKDAGYWVVGCDAEGDEDATTFAYPRKRVIVMGNEAEGMRRLVRDTCDYLVSIPMPGPRHLNELHPGLAAVESLNVSVAAAIVLYMALSDIQRAKLDGSIDANAAPAPADS